MTQPLEGLPTHLIAGPLGAGKTSTLSHLLAQRPADQRWAVLVNEFGQIGLDAALLGKDPAADVRIAEVAGGCLCCVAGVPFQVGLTRLLRDARPQRLFIEPSGLGHPLALLQQLRAAPWQQALAVQPCVLVLDAAALAAGQPLPPSQAQTLDEAGLLVLNKSEALDLAQRRAVQARLPDRPRVWTQHGQVALGRLPGYAPEQAAPVPQTSPAPPVTAAPVLWLDPSRPQRAEQSASEGWSLGWRWHSSQRFDLARVADWLAAWPWRRAKLIVQTGQGPRSANLLEGQATDWRVSEWRRDSRIELIFAAPQPVDALEAGLAACRVG